MMPAASRLPIPDVLRQHSAEVTFVAGFLFDFFTMQRIDAWLDLAFQLAYLVGLTVLLVLQSADVNGRWHPGRMAAKLWQYNVEALHFLYGGLLSAYVVLYFRSSTLARPAVFMALLVGVMLINEVPRIRNAGYRLRLGLYAFCVLSFLTYFIPILFGRIGGLIFLLSLVTSAGVVWLVSGQLARGAADRLRARLRLCAPAAGLLAVVGLLYVLRLIPPVPLSVQFHGIYHDVRRENGVYTLVYQDAGVRSVWRRDSRPFLRRPGDRLHYFARVFAPTGFAHRVIIRWEFDDPAQGWVTTDRIPLNVVGGRAEGFRGYAVKANFTAGRWRVTAETEDGRAIATLTFNIEDDTSTAERRWRSLTA